MTGALRRTLQPPRPWSPPPLAHVDLSAESVDVGGSDFAVSHSFYVPTLTDPKTKAPVHEHGNLLIGLKRPPDGALSVAWEIASDTPAPT